MMFTKHLISGVAAAAIVTTVGLAYAQTTSTTPGSTASSPATDAAVGTPGNPATPGMPASDSTMTGSQPTPQADRN